MKQLGLFLCFLTIACGEDAPPPDAGPDANIAGTYSLSWAINTEMGAACDAVGSSSVRVLAFEENAALGEVESFNCSDFVGTSRPVVAGNYRFEIDLRSTDGRSLLPQPINVFDVDIEINGNSEVGAQNFAVTPTGSIAFGVASEGAAANCDAIAAGGAGITGLRFDLRDSGGACVPTTFVAGAESYTSDCTQGPTPLACFESSQMVTVAATPSGPHSVEMRGIVTGVENCRKHTASVSIIGNNLGNDLGVRMMALDTTEPGCDAL